MGIGVAEPGPGVGTGTAPPLAVQTRITGISDKEPEPTREFQPSFTNEGAPAM